MNILAPKAKLLSIRFPNLMTHLFLEKFYESDCPQNPKPNDFTLINPAVWS